MNKILKDVLPYPASHILFPTIPDLKQFIDIHSFRLSTKPNIQYIVPCSLLYVCVLTEFYANPGLKYSRDGFTGNVGGFTHLSLDRGDLQESFFLSFFSSERSTPLPQLHNRPYFKQFWTIYRTPLCAVGMYLINATTPCYQGAMNNLPGESRWMKESFKCLLITCIRTQLTNRIYKMFGLQVNNNRVSRKMIILSWTL